MSETVAEAAFRRTLDWLREHFGEFRFFVERDLVWTLQQRLGTELGAAGAGSASSTTSRCNAGRVAGSAPILPSWTRPGTPCSPPRSSSRRLTPAASRAATTTPSSALSAWSRSEGIMRTSPLCGLRRETAGSPRRDALAADGQVGITMDVHELGDDREPAPRGILAQHVKLHLRALAPERRDPGVDRGACTHALSMIGTSSTEVQLRSGATGRLLCCRRSGWRLWRRRLRPASLHRTGIGPSRVLRTAVAGRARCRGPAVVSGPLDPCATCPAWLVRAAGRKGMPLLRPC